MKHCDMIKTNNSLFEVVSSNLRVTDLFYLQTNINVCTSLSPVESKKRTEIQKKQVNQSNYFLVFNNRKKNVLKSAS
jgi:hypothetical protein